VCYACRVNKPLASSGDVLVFREIVETSPVVAFVWRLEAHWPVEFVSDSVSRFGYTREEFLSGAVHYADLIHPDDRRRVKAEVEGYLHSNTRHYRQRYRIMARGGEEIWIDDWTSLVGPADGEPEYAYGIILDVSEDVAKDQRLHQYLNAAGSIFLYLDRRGHVTDCNHAACQLTRLTPQELHGVHWIDRFVPDEVAADVKEVTAQIITGEYLDPGEFTNEIEVNCRRHLIRWTFTLDHDPSGEVRGLVCFGQDITETRGLAERLADIANSIPGALIEYRLHADGSNSTTFLNGPCEGLWEVSTEALAETPSLLWDVVLPEDLKATQESVQRSAESLDVWQHEWRIRTPGGRLKWLQGTGRPRRQPNGDIRWATTIIDITESKRAIEAKVGVLNKAVHALAAIVEARDPYTAGHEINVARISVAIARQLGLTEQQIDGLELAATIHDIGKISVPAEILSKPTQLSDVEYELVKEHARRGADFVRDIDFDRPIATIIEQHHERIDGSGYPDGLRGDDILIEARIIGAADTLEAIASHRPYRPGRGLDRAIETLQQGRGKTFDADVVDACTALVRSGAIRMDDAGTLTA
jgi:PAS domain S-box-containing protein/putative nucleotidyltransferase with HDIG domain